MSQSRWEPILGQESRIVATITALFLASCSAISIAAFHFMRATDNISEFYNNSRLSLPASLLSPSNLLFGLLIIPIFLFFLRMMLSQRKLYLSALVISVIFSLFTVFSLSLEASEYTHLLLPARSFGANMVLNSLVIGGFVSLYYFLINAAYFALDRKTSETNPTAETFNEKRAFFLAFFLILLFWIPIFVICYPGTVITDTLNQIKMFLGVIQLDASHPVLTSAFLGSLFYVGSHLVNDNFGVFLMVLVQSTLNALIMALTAVHVRRYTHSIIWYCVTILFFGVCPIWQKMSQQALKDAIHTGCYLLFYLQFLRCIKEERASFWDAFVLAFYVFLISFTRKATFYLGVICMLIAIASHWKKYWLKYGVTLVAVVTVFFVCNKVIYPSMGFRPEREVENYSLQLQQMALYCRTYQAEMSKDEIRIINTTLDFDTVVKNYTPMISDPVKRVYKTKNDHSEFWDLYRRYVLKRPLFFVKATVMNTFEYMNLWYDGNDAGVYIAKEPSFYRAQFHNEIIVWRCLGYWNSWFKVPVLRLFVAPGLYLWCLLLLLCYTISKRSLPAFLGLTPSLTLMIGLIFSHVNGNMRYAVPLVASIPLLFSFVIDSVSLHEQKMLLSKMDASYYQKRERAERTHVFFLNHVRNRLNANRLALALALRPYRRAGTYKETSEMAKSVRQNMLESKKEIPVYNFLGDVLLIDFLAIMCNYGGNENTQTFGKIHYATISKYTKLWQGLPFEEELEAVLSWIKLDRLSDLFSLCLRRIREKERRGYPKHLYKRLTHSGSADGISRTQLIELRGDLIALGQQSAFAGNMKSDDFCQLLRCLALERGLLQIDAFDLAYEALGELAARGVSYAVHIPDSQQVLQKHILELFERSASKEELDALSKLGQFAVDTHSFSVFSTVTFCWQTDLRSSNLLRDEILTSALKAFGCEGVCLICYVKKDNVTGISSKGYEFYLYSSRDIPASKLLALYHRGCGLIGQYDWSILCDSSQEPDGAWQAYSQMVNAGVRNCCERLLREDRSSQAPIEEKRSACEKSIQYALGLVKHAKLDQS